MAETEQSHVTDTTTEKHSTTTNSFTIWPPTDRTRDAVRNRLIETLSSPSILSKRYGTLTGDEAIEAAKVIEDEAFEVAGKTAKADDEGIGILQVYSKEISKRMLEKVKSRSADSESASTVTTTAETTTDAPIKAVATAEEEELGSAGPPQSEKTDSVAGDE